VSSKITMRKTPPVPTEAALMTCSTYEGSAPAQTWTEVTALFVAAFAAQPYEEDPQELALIAGWGPTQLAQPSGRLTVAEQGEHVVGFALVHSLAEDEPWQSILATMSGHSAVAEALSRPETAVIVHELAVRPMSRGQGVARTCLREVLRGRDETRVFIGVYDSATDAVAMYERWGLIKIGAFRGADSDVTLLVLTLPAEDLRTRLGRPSTAVGDR